MRIFNMGTLSLQTREQPLTQQCKCTCNDEFVKSHQLLIITRLVFRIAPYASQETIISPLMVAVVMAAETYFNSK